MIDEISIRDLGVIKSAVLRLTPGFTAVTGETGAGKTMVVSALGLLLGERADSGVVRHDAERAQVDGRWRIDSSEVAAAVNELGGVIEDGELIVSRSVTSEGRSRVVIGGVSAPVGALGALGEHLVAIHGQSDQLRLRSQSAQRDAVDRFAGEQLRVALREYQDVFRRWTESTARLQQLTRDAEARRREADELRAAVVEIDGVQPVAGEDVRLKSVMERLANGDDLRRAAQEAHEALSAEDSEFDAVSLVESARKALERVAGHDATVETLLTQLSEASIIVRDAAAAVSLYANGLDVEGDDIETVQHRVAVLNALVRKYGPTLEDVLEMWSTASDRLFELDRTGDEIGELTAAVDADRAQLEQLAGTVSRIRSDAAQKLSRDVTEELHHLAMPTAEFVVAISTGDEFHIHGRDGVDMLLRPHPGGEPKPVTKTASGGELSRVMLAIEVVIAGTDTVPTLVFDEIDAGVGGSSAIEIGRRLAKLAETAQVIVVTHLPQVAAFATNHLRIIKDTSGDVTESTITPLSGDERVAEMARLLSGTDSENARAHAQEMLDSASRGRGALG
ncbi:MAG: repair protein RecN [Actinomycetota bacterium]|jgi:DNA repair protein RecN (Recombination protein N)